MHPHTLFKYTIKMRTFPVRWKNPGEKERSVHPTQIYWAPAKCQNQSAGDEEVDTAQFPSSGSPHFAGG